MKKIIFIMLLISGLAHANNRNRQIYVPNAETAIAIAEAIAVPIYGRDTIDAIKPFSAKLNGNIWVVEGKFIKNRTKGGLIIIRLSKFNGGIIDVYHED